MGKAKKRRKRWTSMNTANGRVTADCVLDQVEANQGICLDDNDWEYIALAKSSCDLLSLETPACWKDREWDDNPTFATEEA